MALPKDVEEPKPPIQPPQAVRQAPQGPRIIIKKPEQPPTKMENTKGAAKAVEEALRSFVRSLRNALSNPKNHSILTVVLLLVAIGLTGTNITGRITGAVLPDPLTACLSNSSVLAAERGALQNALDSIKQTNSQLAGQVRDLSITISAREASLNSCQTDLSATKVNVNKLLGQISTDNSTITKLQSDITSLNASASTTQKNYDTIAQNYANRYCCQLNSLGFNYKAYAIVENNVVCLTSGTKNVTCS